MPCASSTARSSAAWGEPGRTPVRFSPMTATTARRAASARDASPRACSSITRSSMDATKVTPAALIGCRSQGARNHGPRGGPASAAELASTSAVAAMRGPRCERSLRAGCSDSSRSLQVAASAERSYTPSARTSTSVGPRPSSQTRPTSSAAAWSDGRTRSICSQSRNAASGPGMAIWRAPLSAPSWPGWRPTSRRMQAARQAA